MDKNDEKINPVNPKATELLTLRGCVGIVDLITADLVATKWIINQCNSDHTLKAVLIRWVLSLDLKPRGDGL